MIKLYIGDLFLFDKNRHTGKMTYIRSINNHEFYCKWTSFLMRNICFNSFAKTKQFKHYYD
jgi:hypothetical protein